MNTKRNWAIRTWVDEGTDFAGEFENLRKTEGIQNYSTISETKAAFAELTIRSLRKILYRYMEDNGYKYIHKLTHFVTTLISTKNCLIDLIPKKVKFSHFLSIPDSTQLRKFRKPKFENGDRNHVFRYGLFFRKS